MLLADLVKDRRNKLGLTQRAAAIRMGLSNTGLAKVEDGRSPNPVRSTLHVLAMALDLDPAALLGVPGIRDRLAEMTGPERVNAFDSVMDDFAGYCKRCGGEESEEEYCDCWADEDHGTGRAERREAGR